MKVRFVNHVNHIRYKEVEVKSMEQAEEMLDDGNIYDDFDNWEYGKEYGESYVEEVEVAEELSKNKHQGRIEI